ncbi:putative membrane protein [Clostridiales Family XIII bacterium PM5-7]
MNRKKLNSNNIVFILFCLVLGMLMGWVSKDLIGMSIIGAIIKNLGVWVFATSLLAAFSPFASRAAIHVFVYFVGVIGAFYTHYALLGGQIELRTILYWLILALVGALVGFIVWHSGDKEWVGAICGAVPIALLLAEGYPIYHSRSISLAFDIICAIILYILLLDGKIKKLMAIPFILVFTIALVYFNLFPKLLGGWI